MRVILFQNRFANMVRIGSKLQTIRKTARCNPGDMLSLRRWTGRPFRSKQEVLAEAVCFGVDSVLIYRHGILVCGNVADEKKIAENDGFLSFAEMLEWFRKTHDLPFYGHLIQWRLSTPTKKGNQ